MDGAAFGDAAAGGRLDIQGTAADRRRDARGMSPLVGSAAFERAAASKGGTKCRKLLFEEHGRVRRRVPQAEELVVPLGDVHLEAARLLDGEDLAHHVGDDLDAEAL